MTTAIVSSVRVFVALGGNLGGGRAVSFRFRKVVEHFATRASWWAISSLYRSAPVGQVSEQPPFFNAVVGMDLAEPGDPEVLLQELQCLEAAFGRRRVAELRFGPRAIDLDLLSWGEARVNSRRLILPHPRASERAFVLLPLAELAGHSYHFPGEPLSLAAQLARPEVRAQAIERVAPPAILMPPARERPHRAR